MNWIGELWMSVGYTGKFTMSTYGLAFLLGVYLFLRYSFFSVADYFSERISNHAIEGVVVRFVWFVIFFCGAIFCFGMAEIVGLV